MRKLTLNTTDVTDEGLEHIISCESLQSLELVKDKGPSAVHTYIDTYKVLQFFGQMASLKPNRWFDLRLDIDVCELSDQLKEQMPRNVRIVNVGHKK